MESRIPLGKRGDLVLMAAQELEEAARKYAAEAIRLDSQGARGMAIQMYQKAIQTLITLAKIYPEYKLNKIYLDRAMAYQERIKALQGAYGVSVQHETEVQTGDGSDPQMQPGDGSSQHSPMMVEHLKATYDDLVMKEKPNVTWDEVVGLDDAKRALKESIIFPVQRPDLFPLGWPRGLLMYGPPGCGKTMLAAASAAEIEASFITVDAASIMSKWLGEAERNVAKLFTSARKILENEKSPVIVFVDELDSLLGTRNQEVGGEVRVRNQFLKEMDGIADKGKDLHLYIVGATNKPWSLDWPFLRRFQKRLYVPLPDLPSRIKMLEHYTTPLKLDASVKLEDLAKYAEGYSGSDIRDICQGVQLKVVSELFESGKAEDKSAQPREITLADFKDVLRNRKPSISRDMINAYVNWSENFKAL